MYKLYFKRSVKRDLKKIGESESLRILKAIKGKLLLNPSKGKPLKGKDGTLWSFRVGDYRVLYNFNDKELIVLIIRISHRKQIYKTK